MNDNGGSMQNMTLRDWFAGQALAGIISKSPLIESMRDDGCHEEAMTACGAYAYADSMLAERDK